MSAARRTWLAAALAVLLPVLGRPVAALAQATVGVSAETDYQVRGVSLSGGRPTFRTSLAYDHRSGLYGGAGLVFGARAGEVRQLGGGAYAGYARRFGSGLGVDMGVAATRVASVLPVTTAAYYGPAGYVAAGTRNVRYHADYAEVYAGLLRDNLSLHVYLSPNYLHPGQRTAYVDVNAAVRPASRLRVFAHAGVLAPLNSLPSARLHSRADLRVGVAVELPHGEVQLAWSGVSRRIDYFPGYARSRDGVILSASAFF